MRKRKKYKDDSKIGGLIDDNCEQTSFEEKDQDFVFEHAKFGIAVRFKTRD